MLLEKKFNTAVNDVTLNVVEGDITKQTTHAIVNSVYKTLDLSLGQVSKAILQAAGPSIQKECSTEGTQCNGYILKSISVHVIGI